MPFQSLDGCYEFFFDSFIYLFIYIFIIQIVKQQNMRYIHSADLDTIWRTNKVTQETLAVGLIIVFVQSIVENRN